MSKTLRTYSAAADAVRSQLQRRSAFWSYDRILLLLFLLTLPFVNPWVRGDGVGYYAYIRALLIEHDLRFENDWRSANPTFVMGRVDEQGRIRADKYTSTGHLENHFAVGPAILWAPFLISVHVGVLSLDGLGAHIAANGYSRPYRVASVRRNISGRGKRRG